MLLLEAPEGVVAFGELSAAIVPVVGNRQTLNLGTEAAIRVQPSWPISGGGAQEASAKGPARVC